MSSKLLSNNITLTPSHTSKQFVNDIISLNTPLYGVLSSLITDYSNEDYDVPEQMIRRVMKKSITPLIIPFIAGISPSRTAPLVWHNIVPKTKQHDSHGILVRTSKRDSHSLDSYGSLLYKDVVKQFCSLIDLDNVSYNSTVEIINYILKTIYNRLRWIEKEDKYIKAKTSKKTLNKFLDEDLNLNLLKKKTFKTLKECNVKNSQYCNLTIYKDKYFKIKSL